MPVAFCLSSSHRPAAQMAPLAGTTIIQTLGGIHSRLYDCRNQAWVLKNSLPAKLAKLKSRQDALQTIFPGRLDIFCPRFWLFWGEKGVFQQP